MKSSIEIKDFDTGFVSLDLTLNIPVDIYHFIQTVESGTEISNETLKEFGRHLIYIRKTIIEKYMTAKRPRAETGENNLRNISGRMRKSLQIKRETKSRSAPEENSVGLAVSNVAISAKSGAKYPFALETGWRGYTKRKHPDFDTNVFVPPFYYTYNAFFKDNFEILTKRILRAVKKGVNNSVRKNMRKYVEFAVLVGKDL